MTGESQHGGKRPGAGPKSKHGVPMVKLNARVPVQVKAWMQANGGVQVNVDRLVIDPVLAECDRLENKEARG